jgi:hypothetical protein
MIALGQKEFAGRPAAVQPDCLVVGPLQGPTARDVRIEVAIAVVLAP